MAWDWGGIVGDVVTGALQIGGSLLQHKAQKQENKEVKEASKEQAAATREQSLAQQHEMYLQAEDVEKTAERVKVAAALRSAQIQKQGNIAAHAALAGYAASGVVAGEGSAALVPGDIVGRAAEDAFTEIMNGNDQIFTLQQQAAADRRQGDLIAQAGELEAGSGVKAANAAYSSSNKALTGEALLTAGNYANKWLND